MTAPGPNPAYLALYAAAFDVMSETTTDGVLLELVVLHEPIGDVYPKADGMAPHIDWLCGDSADWPCATVRIIARYLGVEVGE
jgi:hypothetical protein